MKYLGHSPDYLRKIGATAMLELSAEHDREGKDLVVEVPHISGDYLVLKVVAEMIAENNRLLTEQLQRLGYLKNPLN